MAAAHLWARAGERKVVSPARMVSRVAWQHAGGMSRANKQTRLGKQTDVREGECHSITGSVQLGRRPNTRARASVGMGGNWPEVGGGLSCGAHT
jgi:hypothetical protein